MIWLAILLLIGVGFYLTGARTRRHAVEVPTTEEPGNDDSPGATA